MRSHALTVESNQPNFLERVAEWPKQPGVYLMRDVGNRILYVGKAKNLRSRVRSYFQDPQKLTPKTRILVKKIADLEFTITNSELEALLLECNLIKKHRPRYNIRLKDDKNFPYVVLDFTHPFPQLRITRKIIPSRTLKYFGPYSGSIRDIGRFILKTFQLRDCSDAKFKNRSRPCLNYEIGTCTAPCVDYVTQSHYANQVREAILFLQGKKEELIKKLKAEMGEASEKQEYERAKTARDKIRAIKRISEKQTAILADNLKDIDVVGRYETEEEIQWLVLFIRGGFLLGRRADKTKTSAGTESDILEGFLEQFYSLSVIPDEIWVPEDFPGRENLQTFLSQRAGKKTVVRVRRGEKAIRLLGMAQENAKLLYQEEKRQKPNTATEELQMALSLPELPHAIEGIDVSNLQGENPAVALVHFADERPLKSRYRLYYPRTIEGQNDFGMIYEVLSRRLEKVGTNPLPDLLLIDGGRGQLSAASKALKDLGISLPLCALAKSRTQRGFANPRIEKSEERIFVPNRKNPLTFREGHPALRLLQNVRDEAHRFSIKHHRKRRGKQMVKSVLTEIPGIGPKTQQKLLKTFGGIEGIKGATIEELKAAGVKGDRAEFLLRELSRSEKVSTS